MKSLKIFVIVGLSLLMGFSAQAFDKSIMQDSSLVLHGVNYVWFGKSPVKSYERCVLEKDSIWDLEISYSGNSIHVRYYSLIPDSIRVVDIRNSNVFSKGEEYCGFMIQPEMRRIYSNYETYIDEEDAAASWTVSYDSIAPFMYLVDIRVEKDNINFDEFYKDYNDVLWDFSLRTLYINNPTFISGLRSSNTHSGYMNIPNEGNVKYARYYSLSGMELQDVVCDMPIVCHLYDADNRLVEKKFLLFNK